MTILATRDPLVSQQKRVGEEPLYEIFNGQRVELPPMSAFASWISSGLFLSLGVQIKAKKLGIAVSETLFILDTKKDIRRRPDVAFVSTQRWPINRPIPPEGDWAVVPDLAVEVISPNDTFQQVVVKMQEYFRYGVGQVWILVPEALQVHVYKSANDVQIFSPPAELDGGDLIPGFRMSLDDLFGAKLKE
jgi:Uma2 family endonuclease